MKLGGSIYYYDEDLVCKLFFKSRIRTTVFLTVEHIDRKRIMSNLTDKFDRLFNTSLSTTLK